MNARQRVIKTLNHEEPDRVPIFCQVIMPSIRNELIDHFGDSYKKERKYNLFYRNTESIK